MQLAISEAEIRELLTAIERGAVHLTPTMDPQDVFAGVVEYIADNGWRLAVFNDANEWDYLQWVEAPDGRRVDYDQLYEASSDLERYTPSMSVSWERYGIPGDGKLHCPQCGATLKRKNRREPFKCPSCLT